MLPLPALFGSVLLVVNMSVHQLISRFLPPPLPLFFISTSIFHVHLFDDDGTSLSKSTKLESKFSAAKCLQKAANNICLELDKFKKRSRTVTKRVRRQSFTVYMPSLYMI